MGRNKDILTKTIYIGSTGEPARLLTESYVRANGNKGFSELVRNLIVAHLGNDSVVKNNLDKELYLNKFRNCIEASKELVREKNQLKEKLIELGFSEEALISYY